MISIVDNIEYLITKHDCVIIPGWGAFIAQYSHAYINADNQFVSPKRTLSFNASINHNDGLLANSIMRKENKSYDYAQSIISNEVQSLKKQLHCGGEVSIGRLGFFTTNNEGQICYEPFADSMACNDFFGLRTLTLCPIEKLEQSTNDTPATINKNIVYVPISRSIFRIAASIVILIGLSFMLSTPVIVDNHQEYASLNLLASKQKAIDEINNRADLYVTIPAEQPQKEEVISNTPTQETFTTPNKVVNKTKTTTYYIIVASLHTRELAERHIINSNDSGMKILEKDGKFRIYVASTATSNEAYAILNDSSFKATHANAWVYRK